VLSSNAVLYMVMEPCNERLSGNRACVERILDVGNAIKAVVTGFGELNTFIKDNAGIERLEAASIKVVLLDDNEDIRKQILEVTFAEHGRGE